ncbi:MAG: DUF2799 domain-containing protein, partial [Pseudomonadales bacterium]|nr:DUF2799 domain-containing protein [Pseudomonadales bacterium]
MRAIAVIGLMVLGGCASLSKDECINADWRLIGYEDGLNGAPKSRIAQHRKACADHDVVPNKASYDAGYEEGILSYCSYSRGERAGQYGRRAEDVCPAYSDYASGYDSGLLSYCTWDMGYNEGIEGRDYLRVCPASLEANFLGGYAEGAKIYDLRYELEASEARVAAIIDEQAHISEHIGEIQRDIVFDKELTVAERLALVTEMNDLANETKALDEEHAALDARTEELRYELCTLY